MTDSIVNRGEATPSNHPQYLTTAEVARATGITQESLEQYRMLRKRGIVRGPDFVRFGRAVLYPRQAVEAFVAARAGSH
jgi:excisionase family DNA binding protein